ncbi:hypothetical protein [Lutimonas sp.]|uniref:hypothetical protein n=1 Tax=Lutimonas sp. TaxID=1872403 RepID=UPI003D9ADEE3
MERSIENIWKEGFLKSDALVAPKVVDLYNKKSIHIIDKFKRMFRINLIAIVVFSFVALVMSFYIGIPIMGSIFFITLTALVIVNKKLLNGLEEIDKGENSYEYLKDFNNWVDKQVSVNKRISRFLYPVIFMSMVLGFYFKDAEGMYLGERLIIHQLNHFPDMILIFGIPLVGVIGVVVVIGLLAFFGTRIYEWDLNLVYGRIFKKLHELLKDVEELRD